MKSEILLKFLAKVKEISPVQFIDREELIKKYGIELEEEVAVITKTKKKSIFYKPIKMGK